MHFPVMIISEKPMKWEDVYDRIGHYNECEDDPMYLEDWDHKFDYWSQGGRYKWMLGGEASCRLADFPMIRPEDTEEELKQKCEFLWKAWKENPKGQTCEECFRNRYCFCLVLPDGTWLEPGGEKRLVARGVGRGRGRYRLGCGIRENRRQLPERLVYQYC